MRPVSTTIGHLSYRKEDERVGGGADLVSRDLRVVVVLGLVLSVLEGSDVTSDEFRTSLASFSDLEKRKSSNQQRRREEKREKGTRVHVSSDSEGSGRIVDGDLNQDSVISASTCRSTIEDEGDLRVPATAEPRWVLFCRVQHELPRTLRSEIDLSTQSLTLMAREAEGEGKGRTSVCSIDIAVSYDPQGVGRRQALRREKMSGLSIRRVQRSVSFRSSFARAHGIELTGTSQLDPEGIPCRVHPRQEVVVAAVGWRSKRGEEEGKEKEVELPRFGVVLEKVVETVSLERTSIRTSLSRRREV